ncbi:MAG: ADP-heptose synthase [Pedosphaera sp.]|nr:ADP-heptose synthase [Pedosphaera sp.]
METASKILTAEALTLWRRRMREAKLRVVVTNGCFDLLHAGHVAYLEAARSLGDVLLVGLNGDESVRQLKGPARPLNVEADRARVLAALECLSVVVIFPEKRAVTFLTACEPDIYVKGGDYTLETIDGDERRAVESSDGQIVFIPFLAGRSTSGLVTKIQTL